MGTMDPQSTLNTTHETSFNVCTDSIEAGSAFDKISPDNDDTEPELGPSDQVEIHLLADSPDSTQMNHARDRSSAIAERDYVDTSLFSPEVSRHHLEAAHRRARTLQKQLQEEAQQESKQKKTQELEPSSSFSSKVYRRTLGLVSHMTGNRSIAYERLDQARTAEGRLEDGLDTDGDGIELHMVEEGTKEFSRPPARRSSGSIVVGVLKKDIRDEPKDKMKAIRWNEASFVHEDQVENLVLNGRVRRTKSSVPRLSSVEKQELYRCRPDLQIVPNWAQKFREETRPQVQPLWMRPLVWLSLLFIVLLLLFGALLLHGFDEK